MKDNKFHSSVTYSYKSIGANTLNSLPRDWHVSKLGELLSSVSEKNRPELTLLSITREGGVIVRDVDDQESNHNFIPDDLSGYKVIKAGQFGMNKMKAWQGSYGVSQYTGIVSPAYFIFDLNDKVSPRFFNWAIRSKLYVSFFAQASDGVRIGQWDLSRPKMKQIPFLHPAKPVQNAISDYLDKKTIEIDNAIAAKEAEIDRLKEYRVSLIDAAVTGKIKVSV